MEETRTMGQRLEDGMVISGGGGCKAEMRIACPTFFMRFNEKPVWLGTFRFPDRTGISTSILHRPPSAGRSAFYKCHSTFPKITCGAFPLHDSETPHRSIFDSAAIRLGTIWLECRTQDTGHTGQGGNSQCMHRDHICKTTSHGKYFH